MGGCGRPSYFSLPKSPASISAVDDEIASSEITARIGCKIHHGGRDLARFADAAHRREFLPVSMPFRIGPFQLCHLPADVTGGNAVDADTTPCPFSRKRFC